MVTGGERTVYHSGEIEPVELQWHHTVEPDVTVPRPRGYLIHAGWPQVEAAVAGHHLSAFRLTEPVTLEVETIRVSDPSFSTLPYQGAVTVTDVTVDRRIERRGRACHAKLPAIDVTSSAIWSRMPSTFAARVLLPW